MIVLVFVLLSYAAGQQVCYDVSSPRVARVGKQCGNDWDCGVMPYVQCTGGSQDCNFQTLGLASDDTYIYYVQSCRSDYGFGTLAVKKVAASGGNPIRIPITFIYEQGPVYTYNGPNLLYELYNNVLYYTIYPAPDNYYDTRIRTVNLQTHQFGPILESGVPGYFLNAALDFDKANHRTYACVAYGNGYNIYRYNGIIGQDSNVTRTYLYTIGSPCMALRSQETTDYFYVASTLTNSTGTFSRIHRGSKSCVSCSTPPTLLFALFNSTISDFVVVGQKFFFVSEHGVFSSDFSGHQIKQISTAQDVTGIQYANGSVVWNENVDLYSVNSSGSNLRKINWDLGKCNCSFGFTGEYCTTCNGQIEWNDGVPICVAIDENNYPNFCRNAFECHNLPWTTCPDFSCRCRSSDFIFPQCNQCTNSSKTVHWVGDAPYCA